jgi:hypothetical protein
MAAEQDDMQDLIDQVTNKCLVKLRKERETADQTQLEQINSLFEHWSNQAFERTKELINSSLGAQPNGKNGLNGALADTVADMKDRQTNLLGVSNLTKLSYSSHHQITHYFQAVQDTHNKQLVILRSAIGEERKQFAQAQLVSLFVASGNNLFIARNHTGI